MRKLIVLRRLSQVFFLSFFVYILWSTTYPLQGAISPQVLFKTNPNIMMFTSIAERLFLPGIIVAVIIPILTLFLGRFFCGWVCPLGTLIDMTGAVRGRRKQTGDNFNKKISQIKYFILFGILGASLFGIQVAWVFDPLILMARFTSLNFIPTITLLFNNFFIFLIRDLGLSGPVYDIYRNLKETVLGVKVAYFSNAPVILAFFLIILLSSVLLSRLWCRVFCPLGGLYSIIARFSLLKRVFSGCIDCGKCNTKCRMGAINKDISYRKCECILCMDCIYECPPKVTKFTFKSLPKKKVVASASKNKKGITRKDFLLLLAGSFLAMGFGKKKGIGRNTQGKLIRPPGALKEKEFLSRCVRCGNCMKVCPTNVLQPSILESGVGGIWTPHLVNEIGYCEYNCTLCGNVCPTGAIPKMKVLVKQKTKLGIAKVDRTKCIAWAYNSQCLVCEEHCPVSDKAIKIDNTIVNGTVVGRPVVDPDACIGCGICQNKCPIRPDRAIKVYPEKADRG